MILLRSDDSFTYSFSGKLDANKIQQTCLIKLMFPKKKKLFAQTNDQFYGFWNLDRNKYTKINHD